MRGHIVYEVAGRRYVMIPRDHRIQPRCSRCAFFTQRGGEFFLPCPADARGNKVCDYGHQWTFKWIPAAKRAQPEPMRISVIEDPNELAARMKREVTA